MEPSVDTKPDADKKEKDDRNVVIRYLDDLLGMPDDPNQPRFIAYPVLGYAPETSLEMGASGLYVYYANDDPRNRLSEIKAFGFYTLKNQFGLYVRHANFTDKGTWFFLGEGRFQSFPLQYHGIGVDTPAEPVALVDQVTVMLDERFLRKIAPSLYTGPGFGLERLSSVTFNFEDGVEPELPKGAAGSFNLGLGASIVYDTRRNVLNVRDGVFSDLSVFHSDEIWGSDFTFWAFESDNRLYIPVNSRDTLALQLYGRATVGDVPYNALSLMGGESLMRGYYLGRYRDKNYVGTQAEYRFLPLPFLEGPIARRFGASLFGGAGVVFPGGEVPAVEDIVLAGGTGLRFLIFPDKDIYTRADLAFTSEGQSFYIFIGEAF